MYDGALTENPTTSRQNKMLLRKQNLLHQNCKDTEALSEKHRLT